MLVKTGRRHFLGRLIDPVRCDHEAPDCPITRARSSPSILQKAEPFHVGHDRYMEGAVLSRPNISSSP